MDDKARVLLGLLVPKNQTAILMHLEYRVKPPDHDFPIGEKHKLIPSVYVPCKKNKDGSIGHKTYVAIRSGKHDKSSAASDIKDFRAVLSLDEFKEACLKDGHPCCLYLLMVDQTRLQKARWH